MPINLSKLSEQSLLDKETNPREIFNLLPEKAEKYKYPRDVQSEVWDRWLERRNDQDIVLKMNTGGGKTVVGLLILKSSLNEGVGPAVYIAPDKYLVRQVLKEAADLGIEVVQDPRSGSFLQGKAILVTNIYQLINGRSVFGTSDSGIRINIGTLLLDDAHACLATTEAQFTLGITSDDALYAELLKIFRDDLLEQSEAKLLEIEVGVPGQELLVPFWAWHQKHLAVAKVFTAAREQENVMFSWPLIKNHLSLCRCVFSGSRVEISPKCLPIEAIPSFVEAKRRIFMTATLADDSILVSDFNANPDSVANHVTPKVANDIGDRMILMPQEIDPALADADIKAYLKAKSKKHNTVVIVPSTYRADFWRDAANHIVTADNLEAVVESLKRQHVGLVVMINKYDGIDLPGNACRILVLDGLPQARRLFERVETNILAGSAHGIARQVQRIEQGMGRGVRANDDYCVVLLMGASLTKTIFLDGARTMFSPATRAQLDKSEQMAEQLTPGLKELDGAIEVCLKQDKDWKRVARETVANVAYPSKGVVRPIAQAQRQAFDHAAINAHREAVSEIQEALNALPSKESNTTKGWLKWQLAEYTQARDPVQAQQVLKSALQLNRRVTRPMGGIDYERLDARNLHQAQNATWKLRTFEGKGNNLLVQVNGILDDLQFAPDNSNQFEAAIHEIAEFLGFKAQRPELEFKKGPDNLWAVGNLKYFVVECKSSATVPMISKYFANQLSGSVNWFREEYDQTCTCVPIMVHPYDALEPAATGPQGMRIITQGLLQAFRERIRKYSQAASASINSLDAAQVQKLLEHHGLTAEGIVSAFTVPPRKAK